MMGDRAGGGEKAFFLEADFEELGEHLDMGEGRSQFVGDGVNGIVLELLGSGFFGGGEQLL